MPDLGTTGTGVVIVLAFVLIGWYIPGSLLQRRAKARGVRVVGAAAEALAQGEAPTFRPIAGTGFQIIVAKPKAPFRKVGLVVLFVMREALLLWLVALARSRGDSFVVRADLRERPRRAQELDAAAVRAREPALAGLRKVTVAIESPHLIVELRGVPADGTAFAEALTRVAESVSA